MTDMALKVSKPIFLNILLILQAQVNIGTFIFSTCGFLAMFGTYWMSDRNYKYSSQEAALYMAFSPIMWCSALVWGILINVHGYTGTYCNSIRNTILRKDLSEAESSKIWGVVLKIRLILSETYYKHAHTPMCNFSTKSGPEFSYTLYWKGRTISI